MLVLPFQSKVLTTVVTPIHFWDIMIFNHVFFQQRQSADIFLANVTLMHDPWMHSFSVNFQIVQGWKVILPTVCTLVFLARLVGVKSNHVVGGYDLLIEPYPTKLASSMLALVYKVTLQIRFGFKASVTIGALKWLLVGMLFFVVLFVQKNLRMNFRAINAFFRFFVMPSDVPVHPMPRRQALAAHYTLKFRFVLQKGIGCTSTFRGIVNCFCVVLQRGV